MQTTVRPDREAEVETDATSQTALVETGNGTVSVAEGIL
jgi:hypothetical protein